MPQVVVSLTTIPPRFAHVGETLRSLLRQSAAIDKIILWVPRTYRRIDCRGGGLPDVPQGVELRLCDMDYGPATKVLPAVRAFAGQDVRIIYCGDDQIYDQDWALHFLSRGEKFAGRCLTGFGRSARFVENRFQQAQPARQALRRLGDLPERQTSVGRVDIAQGFSGVMTRPGFFSERAFDIPGPLWPAGDIWLSGQMALNGRRIRQVFRQSMSERCPAAGQDQHDGYDRMVADMACVEYFRQHHGIWKRR